MLKQKSYHNYFRICYDERLGIEHPYLICEYEKLPQAVQDEFELVCQKVVSQIPERLKILESRYMERYQQLQDAADLQGFDQLIEEMNDLSSRICDLNLLYRMIEGEYLGANVHGWMDKKSSLY